MRRLSDEADILLLDGGSTDGSLEFDFLQEQGVRALLRKQGPGRLSAQLRMGYAFAMLQGYQGTVTIDGNNKDGPEAIREFSRALDDGVDLVQGSRFLPGGQAINTPLTRWLAIRLVHAPWISLVSGFRYTDTTNDFRAYSRRFLLDPRVQPFRDVFSTYELLAYMSIRGPKLGYRVKEIPVTRRYPAKGKTPTKIHPIVGNLSLLGILLKASLGHFDPQ